MSSREQSARGIHVEFPEESKTLAGGATAYADTRAARKKWFHARCTKRIVIKRCIAEKQNSTSELERSSKLIEHGRWSNGFDRTSRRVP